MKEDSSLYAPTNPGTWKNGKSGFSFGANLGYQFSKTWGVEVGYQWMPKSKLTAIAGTAGNYIPALDLNDSIEVKSHIIDAAIKGTMGVSDAVSAFAKIGFAYTSNEVKLNDGGVVAKKDTNSTNALFGFGLAYHIDSNWHVSVEWNHVVGGKKLSSATAATLGAAPAAGVLSAPYANLFKFNVGYCFNV